MTRGINNITDATIEPYFAVELYLDGNTLRFWSGIGDRSITVGSSTNTFLGAGNLIAIGTISESADLSARSVSVTFSGLTTTLVSAALEVKYQSRKARILFGLGTGAAIEVFGGFMDVMVLSDSSDASSITITIESRLVELERVRPIRYTDENHRSRYPTDSYFSYNADLQDKEVLWGRAER